METMLLHEEDSSASSDSLQASGALSSLEANLPEPMKGKPEQHRELRHQSRITAGSIQKAPYQPPRSW